LSLRLYLDDCIYSHELRRLLVEAGHDVQVPADVYPPLTGQEDQRHFAHACNSQRVLLTKNPRDFQELHRQSGGHRRAAGQRFLAVEQLSVVIVYFTGSDPAYATTNFPQLTKS